MPAPRNYRRWIHAIPNILVRVGTLPYYRFYEFNTLVPLQQIARNSSHTTNSAALLDVLCQWRQRKLAELQYISIACAILLGAVIGTFSWNNVDAAYWLTRACWYITLLLAVLGILLSAQQITVLNFLGDIPDQSSSQEAQEVVNRYLPLLIRGSRCLKGQPEAQCRAAYTTTCAPNKRMVFIWQCPIMLMSYSALLFLLGLTVLVITPLIRLKEQGWTPDATVAIIYLSAGTVLIAVFVFSAFWVYHYLDNDVDIISTHSLSTARNGESNLAMSGNRAAQDDRGAAKRIDSFPFGRYKSQSTMPVANAPRRTDTNGLRRTLSADGHIEPDLRPTAPECSLWESQHPGETLRE